MGILEIHFDGNGTDAILEKIKEFFSDGRVFSKREQDALKRNLEKYMENFYEKNRYINTIVFQGVKKKLVDLYVPIVIKEAGKAGKNFNMNQYECLSVFQEHSKILIVDTAGMGKSTLVKYLSINLYERKEHIYPIPVVIELRKIQSSKNIAEEIRRELSLISESISLEQIQKMMDKGGFIIFLDGYDELEDKKKNEFADAICDLANKAGENFYIITSREENTLSGFNGFQRFSIEPFTKEQAYKLIRKYDGYGEVAEQLISDLEGSTKMRDLNEFLSNPLLTSLLYMAYKHRNIIPNRKHLFYEQVYEALFQGHDLTKGGGFVHEKRSGLDKEAFQKVLNRFGFLCINQSKISMSKEELIFFIEKSLATLPTGVTTATDVVDDLLRTVPLIFKDGLTYQWVHKSFAEYFAACFICKDSPDKHEKLKKIAFGSKFNSYSNVFDFCFDMDESAVRESVIKEILQEYIKHDQSIYQDDYYKNFPEILINRSKGVLFLGYVRFIKNVSLPDDVLEEYIEAPFKDGKLKYFTKFEKKEYVVAYYDKKYVNALQVIYSKGIDIFDKDLTSLPINSENYNRLNEEEFDNFVLDDDVNAVYNQMDCFKEVVEVMHASRDKNKYYLSKEKCKKVLDEIELEIQAQKADIFDI